MKTITLITMLLVTCVSNAQLNLEFESMLDQKIVGHPSEAKHCENSRICWL